MDAKRTSYLGILVQIGMVAGGFYLLFRYVITSATIALGAEFVANITALSRMLNGG